LPIHQQIARVLHQKVLTLDANLFTPFPGAFPQPVEVGAGSSAHTTQGLRRGQVSATTPNADWGMGWGWVLCNSIVICMREYRPGDSGSGKKYFLLYLSSNILSMNRKSLIKFLLYFIPIVAAVLLLLVVGKLFLSPNELQPFTDAVNFVVPAAVLISAGSFIFPRIAKFLAEGGKSTQEITRNKNASASFEASLRNRDNIKLLIKEILNEDVVTGNQNNEDNSDVESEPYYSEEEHKLDLIERNIIDIQFGISEQIDKISNNRITNLLIGLALTIVAIVLLILVVYADDAPAYLFDETSNSGIRFFIHMIPRLSIVLFVEIFSFFFLNLYKRNSDEIKYYNNERTNIESKLIALKMSVIYGDIDSTKKTIESLYKTDRNSAIKKGETTIELEKLKYDVSSLDKAMETIGKMGKLFGGKDGE
jgi:hypothetical protein